MEEPRLIWQANGLGSGYSSVTISEDMIFTQEYSGDTERIYFLSENVGRLIWSMEPSVAAKVDSPGSRAAPTIEGNHLYVETTGGTVLCVKNLNGPEVWRRQLKEEFQGRQGGRGVTWNRPWWTANG